MCRIFLGYNNYIYARVRIFNFLKVTFTPLKVTIRVVKVTFRKVPMAGTKL